MINTSDEVLRKRFNFAKSQFELYKPRLDEAYHFTQPYRDDFYMTTEGEIKGKDVLDPTAVIATSKFVSSLQKLLTPANKRFMTLKANNAISSTARKAIDDELQGINDTVWKYINKSNGVLAMSETYYDVACGTGALQIREGTTENPLVFSAHPISSIYLERSTVNTIQNVWREYNIPCQDVPIMWPNATIPHELSQLIDESQGNEIVQICEGTLLDYQRGDNDEKYFYVVMYNGEKIFSEEIDSSPWIIYRWQVPPKQSYGVGVTQSAIGSIRTLNKLWEQTLMVGDMSLMTPIMYDSDSGFNPFNTRIQPNAMIPVTNISSVPIRPLDFKPNLGFAYETIQNLQQQINQFYFTDPLGSFEEPVRTATEMSMRFQSNTDNLEGPFSRLAVEFLTAMFRRILFILQNKGLVGNINIDGEVVDLYFELPLMEAQGLESLNKLLDTKQAITAIAGPRVSSLAFEAAEIPALAAQLTGADTRVVKGPEQIKQEARKILKTVTDNTGG